MEYAAYYMQEISKKWQIVIRYKGTRISVAILKFHDTVFSYNRGQLKNPDISGALYTLRIQY